jgi:hypothetical protein
VERLGRAVLLNELRRRGIVHDFINALLSKLAPQLIRNFLQTLAFSLAGGARVVDELEIQYGNGFEILLRQREAGQQAEQNRRHELPRAHSLIRQVLRAWA